MSLRLSSRWGGKQKPTLERDVSFLSQLSYWWINRVVSAGHRRGLQLSDLCCLGDEDSAQSLCSALQQQQHHRRTEGRSHSQESGEEESLGGNTSHPGVHLSGPALLCHLYGWLRPSLLQVTLLRMTSDLLALLPPQALRCGILYCENQPVFDWSGLTHALALLAAVVCHALVQQVCERHSRMTEVRVQTALTGALYKQALSRCSIPGCLPSSAPSLTPLRTDVGRLAELPVSLSALWSSWVQGTVCVCLLWRELGPSSLAGLAVLLLLVPLTSAVQRRARLLQRSQERVRGERQQLVQEMLNGIKTVKLLVLEAWFQCRVGIAREKELETLRILGFLTAFSLLDRVCVPFLVCVSSLGVYVLVDDGNVLTASQVFTCVCLFTLLRSPFNLLPSLALHLTQTWHSLCHLDHFLFSQEVSHTENGTLSENGVKKSCLEEHSDRCSSDTLRETEANTVPLPKHGVNGVCIRLYLHVCGWGWVLLTVLSQVCVCVVGVCQTSLLAVWTRQAKELQGLEEWRELRDSRLSVYAVLGLLQALSVCCVALAVTGGSLKASASLHSELLFAQLRLPLRFYQITPSSLVLRSLSQEMYVIDELVPAHLLSWLSCWLQVFVTVLLIGYISPLFILIVPVLTYLFLTIQSYYRSVSGQVRRMVSNSASSLSSLLSESHRDEVTSGSHDDPLTRCYGALNEHLVCRYNCILLDRWVSVWLDAFAGLVLFLVSVTLLDSEVDPSTVGLVLTYTLSLREVLHLLVQASCGLESSAGVIQKMDQHAHMEREPPWSVPCRAPPSWPEEGVVEFRSYETELNPSPAELSFCTRTREKVGVVSRSGAELDAITSSLFRLVEGRRGVLMIDGVDISSVGLHDLRSRLAVITRVPTLFSCSLRSNLDPWGCHGDAQVWQALERCHLKERVSLLPGQLLYPLHYGGAGLSSSEKRLLCVCRALLKGCVVLVVEDPVPPVDVHTERLLQSIIHTHFSHCTRLYLTQNPGNITHTDRVLVLDGGRVAEFDCASALLQRGALFSQLLSETHRHQDTEEE
ncbi:canalicular multispecific organic anion transporter 2 isoform X1 [Salmo trutta]|uniref:canalicular multispecific organic anion transporter 2 isoform X1 n=1 Tax=Salmo trutta TaxID=8032 RepID=UPI00112FEB85|nr:canalicular multispecific organic anion transporter 2-like isoform X1 [Salmo trutta]